MQLGGTRDVEQQVDCLLVAIFPFFIMSNKTFLQVVHAKCVDEKSGIIPPDDTICSTDLKELESWNNTITVTAKGAVIIRFSWAKPIKWTARHAELALRSSRMVCALIENCC